MATSRTATRLSTYLPSFSLKLKNASKGKLPTISPLKSSSLVSTSVKPNHIISRLPVELSCLVSMVPLHSTIASARLRSLLPNESQNWGLVPQGISMPL